MRILLAPLLSLLAACDDGQASPASDRFDESRAWRDLERMVALGSRVPGSEAIEMARAMIERELASLGLSPVREAFQVKRPGGKLPAPIAWDPIPMANVYADLPAADPAAEMILLCTHFDTKLGPEPIPGANDGASGTAVLLELARVLVHSGPRELAYRFLFLDGEESLRWEWAGEDNTYGSRYHAAALKKSGRAERVRCCVLLDLVGDKDLRFLNEVYSDRRLTDLFIRAARKAGLGEHVDGRRAEARDDHLSFMAVGIPSIDLIDFDYGPDNAYWHTKEDTLDKCSAKSLGITGRIVLAALPEIERTFAR